MLFQNESNFIQMFWEIFEQRFSSLANITYSTSLRVDFQAIPQTLISFQLLGFTFPNSILMRFFLHMKARQRWIDEAPKHFSCRNPRNSKGWKKEVFRFIICHGNAKSKFFRVFHLLVNINANIKPAFSLSFLMIMKNKNVNSKPFTWMINIYAFTFAFANRFRVEIKFQSWLPINITFMILSSPTSCICRFIKLSWK